MSLRIAVVCVGLPLLLSVSAWAAPGSQDQARFAVHVTPRNVSKGNLCVLGPVGGFACDLDTGTSSLVTEGALDTDYDVYVLLLDIDMAAGIGGLGFRIEYGSFMSDKTGIDVLSADNCGEYEQPQSGWPENGRSLYIFWSGCDVAVEDPSDPQGQGVVLAAGFYLHAYSAGTFNVLPLNGSSSVFEVLDCSADPSQPSVAGWAGFGTGGCQPCLPNACYQGVPVEATSWGRVKAAYGGD